MSSWLGLSSSIVSDCRGAGEPNAPCNDGDGTPSHPNGDRSSETSETLESSLKSRARRLDSESSSPYPLNCRPTIESLTLVGQVARRTDKEYPGSRVDGFQQCYYDLNAQVGHWSRLRPRTRRGCHLAERASSTPLSPGSNCRSTIVSLAVARGILA